MPTTIHFASFLAPNMFHVYRFIADHTGRRLGVRTTLTTGSAFDEFETGQADAGFLCGLPYVELARRSPSPVELLAAPVLEGERYGGRPVYFSDVIVRQDSPFQSFADLRGRSWSLNDRDSHSGYNVTRHHLVQLGETRGYFGRVIEAGWHQESIRLVRDGLVDASAIDSQVLAIEERDQPRLADRLRVIDRLGPSTIQPVVAAGRLPASLKAELRAVLLEMANDPAVKAELARGLIDHFAPVVDGDYDDIRRMLAAAEAAGFLTLA